MNGFFFINSKAFFDISVDLYFSIKYSMYLLLSLASLTVTFNNTMRKDSFLFTRAKHCPQEANDWSYSMTWYSLPSSPNTRTPCQFDPLLRHQLALQQCLNWAADDLPRCHDGDPWCELVWVVPNQPVRPSQWEALVGGNCFFLK